jgi:magnesium-transporting ATPase (P-type)
MTVIVRDPEGLIRVMCKGADSVIEPRLKGKPRLWEKTNSYLEGFAKEGLRTLLLVEKEITEEFFFNLDKKYKKACFSLNDREEKMAAVAE